MTREDINNIIQTLCPNDEDFEKPIISPAYLKQELEAVALEQKPCGDTISRQVAIDAVNINNLHPGIVGALQSILAELPPVTPQPCSNAIDRAEAIKIASGFCHPANVAKELAKLPPVTAEPKMGRCKDCKYFEYDSVAKVDGIPLIVAHEICSKWGDGCKTKEDGYCYLFEPQETQESDHKCHTCKHYTSGEYDGSCGSYICKNYSDWESEEV